MDYGLHIFLNLLTCSLGFSVSTFEVSGQSLPLLFRFQQAAELLSEGLPVRAWPRQSIGKTPRSSGMLYSVNFNGYRTGTNGFWVVLFSHTISHKWG